MARLLTIVSLLFIAASTAVSQQTLFQETFPGGVAQNAWSPGFNGDAIVPAAVPGNPSGDGWVGSLANNLSGGNVGESFASGAWFSDFYYEAQVYIPVDEGIYYGLEFRVDTVGISAGYQFVAMFRPGGMTSPRLRFRVRSTDSPGMPSSLRDWEDSEVPGGIPTESGWHKMAVYAKGHAFRFFFDGQELPGGGIMDFTFFSGSIGAYVWDMNSPQMQLYIDDINVTSSIPVDVQPVAAVLPQPILHSNYPSPVRTATRISFDLPERGEARLEIFSLLGERIALIDQGPREAGTHSLEWQPGGLPDGVYMLRLTASGLVAQRSLIVLH